VSGAVAAEQGRPRPSQNAWLSKASVSLQITTKIQRGIIRLGPIGRKKPSQINAPLLLQRGLSGDGTT
jgi:hypothetical protein